MSTTTKEKEDPLLYDEDDEEMEMPPPGCGIFGRYPVLSILLFAFSGIGMGIGLSFWEPDDPEDKEVTLKWLGLIGDLFIRALKAVVLPLVFVNVIISVVDMMSLGRASSIGWTTIGYYLVTTIIASVIGLLSIISFQSLFDEGNFEDPSDPTITLGCNQENYVLTEGENGSVTCLDSSGTEESSQKFVIKDISNVFVKKTSGPRDDISLSDTIYDGVFTKIVTSNIFQAFNTANFAAVVFFAIAFGFALGRVQQKMRGKPMTLVSVFKELNLVLLHLIYWIIMLTPFAVWSLITKAIGKQDDLKESFENVGYLVIATITAMLFHFLITHVTLFGLVTKSNPITYLRCIVPAQTMAFACASSAATIPITLKSVQSTGKVPDQITNFVIPLGATINMDGGAIYFPCACVWLAVLNGLDPNVGDYILLIILATVGSAGTAPVPSASLVLIITAYNTVFGTEGTPDGFEFIFAIDWFMDRLRTTMNVTGDAVVAGAVAASFPLEHLKHDHHTPGAAAAATDEVGIEQPIDDADEDTPKVETEN